MSDIPPQYQAQVDSRLHGGRNDGPDPRDQYAKDQAARDAQFVIEDTKRALDQAAKEGNFTAEDAQRIVDEAKKKAGTAEANSELDGLLADVTGNVPPWITAAFGSSTLNSSQIEALRHQWSLNHRGAAPPKTADLLMSLSDSSSGTNQLIVSAAAGDSAPKDYVAFPLGPLYGNRMVPISNAELSAASKFPGGVDHLGAIVRAADRTGTDWQTILAVAQTHDLNTRGTPTPALPGISQAERPGHTSAARSYYDIGTEIAKYSQTYNDPTLVVIAAAGRPDLAAKLLNDPWSLNVDEGKDVMALLTKADWDPQTQRALGKAVNEVNYGFIVERASGVTKDVNVALEDPKKLAESIDTLWRGWFQRTPSQAETAKFVKLMNDSAYEAASETRENPLNPTPGGVRYTPHTNVDPVSRLVDYARSQPEYQNLFANKPVNESEDQYVQGITSGVTNTFGPDAVSEADAIRAGLRTGSASTARGYLANTEEGRKSAPFLERLARAGNVFRSIQ